MRVTQRKINNLKGQYPKGCTIQVERTVDKSVPEGMTGEVIGVTDIGAVNVKLRNGAYATLTPDFDRFNRVRMLKVIRKYPGSAPFVDVIPDNIHDMQDMVGGHVGYMNVTSDMMVLFDEEGHYHNAEENCKIIGYMFCGPIILIGCKGSKFEDVPEKALNLLFKEYAV